ncbi:hypothetical protein BDR07DRAFT_1375944 [Suillus spraguei]|nr:hypothetical protein BDR07DRAFT_1375944 [Suillus spraguei]
MDSILQAGVHRLDDGTIIHVCDCSSCLRKTGGRTSRVSKATYFRHKPSRLASIFLPPVALSIAPDLPSPDLRHTTPPAASSSSKRPQEDLDGGGPRTQKKGRSESPELVPSSANPDPKPDDATEDFYHYDDGLEYDNILESLPDKALPDEALPDEAQNPDHLLARPTTSGSPY